MSKRLINKEFAVYEGDNLVFTGSAYQVAEKFKIKVDTVLWSASPVANKRKNNIKKPRRTIVLLDDDEDEEEVDRMQYYVVAQFEQNPDGIGRSAKYFSYFSGTKDNPLQVELAGGKSNAYPFDDEGEANNVAKLISGQVLLRDEK